MMSKFWTAVAATVGLVFGLLVGLSEMGKSAGPLDNDRAVLIAGIAGPDDPTLDVDPKILTETADIDAIMALRLPALNAPLQDWVEFAHELDSIDLGKGRRNSGVATPLLGWYAYIAKHRPDVIYQLFSDDVISRRKLSHLIEFGLLPGWYDSIEKTEDLILADGHALVSLVGEIGEEPARRAVIDAFFSESASAGDLSIANLKFSLSAMTSDERGDVLARLENGPFRLDPRDIRLLIYDDQFRRKEFALLDLINQAAMVGAYSDQRSMAAYFHDAAELKGYDYLDKLIEDVADNAGQPTNFYCAACSLAIIADGLLGSPLVDAASKNRPINISLRDGEYSLTIGDSH